MIFMTTSMFCCVGEKNSGCLVPDVWMFLLLLVYGKHSFTPMGSFHMCRVFEMMVLPLFLFETGGKEQSRAAQ